MENREWKQKYFDALREVETKEHKLNLTEETLRSAISRLSLVSDQTDEKLEKQLEKIRLLARKKSSNSALKQILEDIDLSIKRIEVERSAGKWHQLPRNQLLLRIVESINFDPKLQPLVIKLQKQLQKQSAVYHLDEYIAKFLNLVSENIQRNLSISDQQNASAKSKTETQGKEGSDHVAGGTAASTSPAVENVESGDDEINGPEVRLNELLSQLSLPIELLPELSSIQSKLNKPVSEKDWPKLLARIADLVSKIRSEVESEKAELQEFLVSITTELKTIESALTTTEANRVSHFQSGKELEMTLQSNLHDIAVEAKNQSDLESLRNLVNHKVERISKHLKEHRQKEDKREQELSSEFEALKARISQMESETVVLNNKLSAERKQSRTDALTGVGNRLAYEQRLVDVYQLWKSGDVDLSLIVCDIDHFKQLNDTHGHQAGDQALQSMAAILRQNVRSTDLLARYGGEEFVVLVISNQIRDENIAEKVAENLRLAVERAKFSYEGEELSVTISCGYAKFCKGDGIEEPFARADKALYQAKKAGRNCVRGSEKRPSNMMSILGL